MQAKQILKIAMNLTVVCFFAGAILGLVNWGTHKAKEVNQHQREVATSMSLLGYSASNPAPVALKMEMISRYLLLVDGQTALGYIVPQENGLELVLLGEEGDKLVSLPAPNMEAVDIDKILSQAVGKSVSQVKHVEDYHIAMRDGRVQGYLITGNNLGFKANIKMMVSLDASFSVRGMAILESEEDPGLGDEAKEPYFSHQFVGKTAVQLAKIQVVTTPQPEEYRKLLETQPKGHFGPDDMKRLKDLYGESPIYSITGSTISSKAVTVGIQKAVASFVSRLRQLNAVLGKPEA